MSKIGKEGTSILGNEFFRHGSQPHTTDLDKRVKKAGIKLGGQTSEKESSSSGSKKEKDPETSS